MRREDSYARRGELDGQGHPVEPISYARHRRSVLVGEREAGRDGPRALREEADCLVAREILGAPRTFFGHRERRHEPRDLSVEAKGLPAGRKDLKRLV